MGQDGVDGRSPKCTVEKKEDGKVYLHCQNADGSAAEAEISAGGEIGGENIALLAQCSYKSDLYSVRYNVLAIDENLKLASLYVAHLKTPAVHYQGAVLHALDDEAYDAAEIRLSAWSAKITGAKKAELTQQGSQPGAMLCK